MGCSCCVTYDSNVIVNDGVIAYDITSDTINVNVDSSQDYFWEDLTDEDCDPIGDSKLYMYGPSKASIQITAYPFRGYQEYTMGFVCPVNVNVQIPWKYVYDCRGCEPCIDPQTGQETGMMRRGRWVAIPQKKKIIQVTGDVEGVSLFSFGGCSSPIAKYTLTAGPSSVIVPQPSMQYSQMEYTGQPMPFDTDNMKTPFRISINTGEHCDWVTNFDDVKVYMTGFTFSFQPPNPPTVSYAFDAFPPYCMEC